MPVSCAETSIAFVQTTDPDLDSSASRREFHRVGEQVVDDLSDFALVGHDNVDCWIDGRA